MDKNALLVIIIVVALIVIIAGAFGIRMVLDNDVKTDNKDDVTITDNKGPSVEEQLLSQQVEALNSQMNSQQKQYEGIITELRNKNQELLQKVTESAKTTTTDTVKTLSLSNIDWSKVTASDCDDLKRDAKDEVRDLERDLRDLESDLTKDRAELVVIQANLAIARKKLQDDQNSFNQGHSNVTASTISSDQRTVQKFEDDEDDKQDDIDDLEDDIEDADDDIQDAEDLEKDIKRKCRNL